MHPFTRSRGFIAMQRAMHVSEARFTAVTVVVLGLR